VAKRGEVGSLSVRVQAHTGEFVSGMARVQQRLDQTTVAATKSRMALAQLGGAMRLPGLGRGAALGGAASGIAGALGIGALSGGVAGVAAAGAYVVVDGLISRYKELNRQIEERRQKEREITEATLAQSKAVAQIAAQLSVVGQGSAAANAQSRQASAFSIYEERRAVLEAQIAQLRSDQAVASGAGLNPGAAREVASRNRVQLDSIRQQIAEAERLLDAAGKAYFNAANGRVNGMRPQRDVAGEANARAAADREARENSLGGRIRDGIEGAVRRSISDIFARLREGREKEREEARKTREAAEHTANALDELRRENQRLSAPLASTVGRLSGQVEQLINQRR
jgi:hypothetical protein